MIEIGWFAFVVLILLAFCGGVVATFAWGVWLSKRLRRKTQAAHQAAQEAASRRYPEGSQGASQDD